MLCRRCRSTNSEVSNTRHDAELNVTTRVRTCLECGNRWKTIESMQKPGPTDPLGRLMVRIKIQRDKDERKRFEKSHRTVVGQGDR